MIVAARCGTAGCGVHTGSGRRPEVCARAEMVSDDADRLLGFVFAWPATGQVDAAVRRDGGWVIGEVPPGERWQESADVVRRWLR